MDDTVSISLVDNTVPSQQVNGESPQPASTTHRQGTLSKHFSRVSVSEQLAKRKYAKWQPDRLGIPTNTDTDTDLSRESSRLRESVSGPSSNGAPSGLPSQQDNGSTTRNVDTEDFAPSGVLSQAETAQSNGLSQQGTNADTSKPRSELDVLYENQRGSFFCGIPLYSHSSLLSFDPSAWMTQDRRASPVNITNAQVPDPSWEWAWRTWYVDMSGDVDDQGWQYAFSFGSSQWHGTHPWFHSFVRRRRWVRLRTKIPDKKYRGHSDFENAHMLNEDYFTIHSPKLRSQEQSTTGLSSQVESGFLGRTTTKVGEEPRAEEIGDIPSLMHALRLASIDRERIHALKEFVQEGGEEIYYLNDKISDIMAMFLFQASRWQFVTYLLGVAQELSQQKEGCDTEKAQRKRDNLIRAAESAKRHITGPDVFTDVRGEAPTELLDLTPVSGHRLLSKRAEAADESLHTMKGKEIKGIPKAAEIGREGHIY